MQDNIATCYQLIDKKANSNAIIQACSGFFGTVVTLAVDAGVVGMIYLQMWNEIRSIYGHPPIKQEEATRILTGIVPEVLSDLVLDKILGNTPIIGIYFNAICAKQMTWRLGMLFTMLSARGASVDDIKCKETMIVIRQLFPHSDMFSFSTPNYNKFQQLALSVKDNSMQEYNAKIDQAMQVFAPPTSIMAQNASIISELSQIDSHNEEQQVTSKPMQKDVKTEVLGNHLDQELQKYIANMKKSFNHSSEK